MKPFSNWIAPVLAMFLVSCGGSEGGSSNGGGNPAGPEPTIRPSSLVGKIVFARASGGRNTLMVMNAEGSGVASLGVDGVQPDVSRDGRRVAYQRGRDLFALDVTTGIETRVATSGSNVSAAWSPDGNRILFWSDRTGVKQLWVVNSDGSSAVRLTDGGGEHHEGDWSPDGSRIVFRRVGEGDAGGDLWVMNADGTGQERLLGLPGQQGNAQWSPDGRRIAFDSVTPNPPGPPNVDVFVIGADGTNLVRLTTDSAEDWAPSWSPDGSRVAFFTFRAGAQNADIYTVRSDATAVTPLLAGSTNDQGPAYGP